MKRKFIKDARLEFNKDGYSTDIMCDVDFAISLHREDIIWIEEGLSPKNFPYLLIQQEDIDDLSDGWYIVVSRRLLRGSILEIQLEEAHEDSYFKERFNHLSVSKT